MKSRGKGLNSASYLVEMANGSHVVEIPRNVNLTPDEAQLWPQFASARAREDWREFDLILLAKAVKLEATIRRHQDILDKTGPIIKGGKSGNVPIKNPMLDVIDVLTRQQLSIIRVLSLGQGLSAPQTQTAHAFQQRVFNQVMEDDTDGLLAKPH